MKYYIHSEDIKEHKGVSLFATKQTKHYEESRENPYESALFTFDIELPISIPMIESLDGDNEDYYFEFELKKENIKEYKDGSLYFEFISCEDPFLLQFLPGDTDRWDVGESNRII